MMRASGLLAFGHTIPDVWECPRCGRAEIARRADGKTPRQARPPAREKLAESYVQRIFMDTATRAGFLVQNMSEHRAESYCDPQRPHSADPEHRRGCGNRFYTHEGTGLSEGVADVGVSHPLWPPHDWSHYEAKGTTTPYSSARQEYLCQIGRNFMFRHPSVGLAQLLHDHQRRVPDPQDRSTRFLRDYLRQYPPPADLVAAGVEGYVPR